MNDIETELQNLWDWQNERIQTLTALPEAETRQLNVRHARTYRQQQMAKYMALTLVSVAVGVVALAAFAGNAAPRIQITGYVLVAVNLFIAVHCLYTFLLFRRHHPARMDVTQMELFNRRMNMQPHYISPRRGRRTPVVPFTPPQNTPLLFDSIRQVAAVSAAAIVVLVFVANTPIGDGHAMSTGDRAARTEAIHNVETILSQI